MNKDDYLSLASALRDLRFIQATALVGVGLNDSKQALAHMRELARLTKLCDEAAKGK